MKNIFILTFALIISSTINSQTNAITETGDVVVLYKNGTWKYVNDSLYIENEITENKKQFKKTKDASFLVKSKITNSGIWINPKEWTFSKATPKDDFELFFKKKKGDLYGVLISEKFEIPLESLKMVAIENAQSVAPDLEVVKEEYRYVNNVKILMMQMNGTIQGMKFTYFGYYYSNSYGTTQMLIYTGNTLFDEYYQDIEKFLNGFVVVK